MGTITLTAVYIRHLREVPINGKRIDNSERVDNTQAELGPVPEKALKGEALTHRAGYILSTNPETYMLNFDTD